MAEGKFSIVIPRYNEGAMLREGLASVEQVRDANLLEGIVVDDGSSEAETTTILSQLELINYIFGRPELACYKLLRETDEEVQQLRGGIRTIQNSPSYRLGNGLLAPARLLRKLWRGFF